MLYEMSYKGDDVLLGEVKVEHGVLFGKIVASYYTDTFNHDACYLRVAPKEIIVSGNFELTASEAHIYDTIEEYQEAMENFSFSDFL